MVTQVHSVRQASGAPDARRFRALLALGERDAVWPVEPDGARVRVHNAQARLQLAIDGGAVVYGTHTDFGADVGRTSHEPGAQQLQLLRYLLVGTGPAFPDRVVRRALRVQVNKLARGFSGIHMDSWDRLVALSNAPTLPRVPREGSLGASGDLIPMVHAVAPIFANGIPGPRDVIACVNTNAMMVAWAADQLARANRLLARAHRVTALTMASLGVDPTCLAPDALALADTEWARAGARIARHLSAWHRTHEAPPVTPITDAPLQAAYSIRCAPQVLGTVAANLRDARRRVLEQADAVTDNPLILGDGRIWHGGLFYAAPLATVADLLVDAACRIGELLDRQVLRLVTPAFSHGLPPNLAVAGESHVKGLHQLASALAQELRGYATLSCVRSFSSESHNQDVVPAAMTALHQAHRALRVTARIGRIAEFVAGRAALLRATGECPAAFRIESWPRTGSRRARP